MGVVLVVVIIVIVIVVVIIVLVAEELTLIKVRWVKCHFLLWANFGWTLDQRSMKC